MHARTLDDVVRPYLHLPKVVQIALLRVETHPTFRAVTNGMLKVLKALVTRVSSKDGTIPIWARLDTVALQAGVSSKTTQRALRTFDELGWVKTATDGRSQFGVYCAKRYVFSTDFCQLVQLPTKENSRPADADETQMSDGGIHDLSFKKDQQEISLQNRQQNPTPISLPESLRDMAIDTGIKESGIAKLRGIAHQAGHKLEDVYVVAKKHLAKIADGNAYRYVLAMILNPKRTDFAGKAAQLTRVEAAVNSQNRVDAAWRKIRFNRYAAGPGRIVTLLHASAQVHENNRLITTIPWRDIGQVINDIDDGVLKLLPGQVANDLCQLGHDRMTMAEQARAARQLLGTTLDDQDQAIRKELAEKALPTSRVDNLALARAMLRTAAPQSRASAKGDSVPVLRRAMAEHVANSLGAIRALLGARPAFSGA